MERKGEKFVLKCKLNIARNAFTLKMGYVSNHHGELGNGFGGKVKVLVNSRLNNVVSAFGINKNDNWKSTNITLKFEGLR